MSLAGRLLPPLTVIPPGKRGRLVESAKTLFHERGVHSTTLAQVAERAGVPLGNIYYYFKTKDELVDAVIQDRTVQAKQLIIALERKRTPQTRLKAVAQHWVEARDLVARYGCPVGSLRSELDKDQDTRSSGVIGPFAIVIDWIEEQFRQVGRRDARDLAFSLLARIEGAALLAQSFRDPEILVREARRLDHWIDGLRTQRPASSRTRLSR